MPDVYGPGPAATGGAYTPLTPLYVAGRWYSNGWTLGAQPVYPAGKMEFSPIFVTRNITVNALGVNMGTAASGGNVKVSIYANSASTNQPTGLPVAEVVLSTTSAAASVIGTVSVTLAPGLYWLSTAADSTAGGVAAGYVVGNANGQQLYGIIGTTAQNDVLWNNASSAGVNATVAYALNVDVTNLTFAWGIQPHAVSFRVGSLNN